MMLNDKAGLKLVVGSVLVLVASAMTVQAQTTIYSDTFGGTSATLNLTTPDISLTGGTWSSATGLIHDDGSIAQGGGGWSALLPFQPQSGNVYTLSAFVDARVATVSGNVDNFIGLGFTQNLPASGGRWQDAPNQPVAWAFARTTTATNFDQSFSAFGGPLPGIPLNGPATSTTKSADNIVMTLDTSQVDWVWTVDFQPAVGVDRTTTLSVVPNINFVGLTSNGTIAATSKVDNFLLTRTDVPAANKWNVNGGGNIGDNGNWTVGAPPAASSVIFGDVLTANPPASPAVINMNVATSVGAIQFSTNQSYSIQGSSTLTLVGPTPTISTVYSTHEIGAVIDGTSGFKKAGVGGTLVLSNDSNTFTGDVLVNQGVLEITRLGAINQLSGVVNVTAGATFRFGAGASGTLAEQVTGAGAIRLHQTLTTESIGFATANTSYTGAISIGGGTLSVQNTGALGSTGSTAATGTNVDGGTTTGKLELASLTVIGERLQIEGRADANLTPALTATGTGTSSWTGAVVGVATSGNQFNLEAQAGSSLTITGDITLPEDTTTRFLNLLGPAGSNGRIEGKIVDRTAINQNINVSVVKKGLGTWTIAHASGSEFEFNNKDTVVEQGTLAVQSNTVLSVPDQGEIWSRTIQIRSGATFDVSSFNAYSLQVEDPTIGVPGDEIGQEVRGSGTINAGVGHTFQAFDDSIITPGDSNSNNGVGTLHINGNYKYSTFSQLGTGRWNYQLGATTSPAVSDQVVVSDGSGTGTATMDAGDADDAININVTPYQATLAQGAYALVVADSVGGTAVNSNYVIKIRDVQGNDITSGVRQTFSVSNSATAVNLNVVGTSADLSWDGSAGSAWDVKTTNNWTGTGGTLFNQLDHVTFGDVANKNVTISTNVAPGSVTFNGGVGTTYVLSGTGSISGAGPVDITSGTVRLQNTGTPYTGKTTIASGARLETGTFTLSNVVANGTLAVLGTTASTVIDNLNSGIGAYTTYTVLDNAIGPADDVVYASTGTAITVNGGQSTGGTAAEQAIAIRAATLAVGQTLVVDTHFNSTPGVFTDFGLVIADSTVAVDVQSPATDTRRSMLFTSMRLSDTPDNNLARFVTSGGTINALPTALSIGTITQLLITRTAANNYTTGYSQDNMATRVSAFTYTGMDWTPNSVGFYADVRGASVAGVGTMDNLRFAPTTVNKLTINGDFTLGSTGTLELDLGQDTLDTVAVTGTATLQGTISVSTTGDFYGINGQTFTILTAANITNAGVSYLLPANFTAQIVGTTSLVLTYSLTGDFNGDTFVNAADYVVWRKTSVDPLGYTAWRETFAVTGPGSAPGIGDAVGVPEPATMTMFLLACCFAALWKRPRTKYAN